MKNGYGICLNSWIEDANIKNELRLLIKISSLTAQNGYCFASNEYFSKYFSMTAITVSRQVNKLKKFGYIKIEYITKGAMVTQRIIRLSNVITVIKNDNHGYQKCSSTVIKNDKDNSTSINNINNNIKDISIFKNSNNTFLNNQDEEKRKKVAPKKEKFNFKQSVLNLGCDPYVLAQWMKVRKVKKAVDNEIAFEILEKEIKKSGRSATECIRLCAGNSWKGFKASWLTEEEVIKPNLVHNQKVRGHKFE